jgi:hypothetical protein
MRQSLVLACSTNTIVNSTYQRSTVTFSPLPFCQHSLWVRRRLRHCQQLLGRQKLLLSHPPSPGGNQQHRHRSPKFVEVGRGLQFPRTVAVLPRKKRGKRASGHDKGMTTVTVTWRVPRTAGMLKFMRCLLRRKSKWKRSIWMLVRVTM